MNQCQTKPSSGSSLALLVQPLRNIFGVRQLDAPFTGANSFSVHNFSTSDVVSFALTRAHDDVYLVPELALPVDYSFALSTYYLLIPKV